MKNIALVNKLTGNPTADLPILSSLQQSLENAIQSSRGLQQQVRSVHGISLKNAANKRS